MKTKTNRIASILLTLCMAFSLFIVMPVTVSALGEVCEIGSAQYATLDLALAATPPGGSAQTVIKLLADVTYPTGCNINNKKITFDLNNHDLIFTEGLEVSGGSNINYTGTGKFEVNSITSASGALLVRGNSVCRLKGASAANGFGVIAEDNSTVTVNGNITAAGTDGRGVYADNSTVTVSGNITARYYGVYAYNNSIITVTGNITVTTGIDGYGAVAHNNSTVTVNGNITHTATDGRGVVVDNNSTATVNGNITVIGTGGYGANAYDSSTVTVNGNITADVIGVGANDGSTATVTGNITSGDYGVFTYNGTVTVNGNITATKNDGIGVYTDSTAAVTVNGTITVNNSAIYIKLTSADKTQAQFTSPTTKAGYLTYTNGSSTVWVKAAATPPKPVTSITVTSTSGAYTITANGGALQMSAAVLPSDAANKSVAWSVTPVTSGAGASISVSGLLTAIGNGTVRVRATANDGSGVYGERTITISGQILTPTPPPPGTKYIINVTAGIGGTASGGGNYAPGAAVKLIATPNGKYAFIGWYESGVKVSGAGAVYTFTAAANRTLEARFAYTGTGSPGTVNPPAGIIYYPIVIGYTITQPSISEKAIEYNKNKDGDIIIRLSMGNSVNGAPYILHGLKNDSKFLVKGTDYTYEGSEITIKASYLKNLKFGEYTISFLTNSSVNPKLAVKIINTAP